MVIISNECLHKLTGGIDKEQFKKQLQIKIQTLDANMIKELFEKANAQFKKTMEDNKKRINQNGI